MKHSKSPIRFYFFAVLATLLWSTSYAVTKLSYESFTPTTLGFARAFLATVVFSIIMLIRREFIIPRKKDCFYLILSGVLGITLYFVLENFGLRYTSASTTSLVVGAYPIIGAIISITIFKQKPSFFKIIGILLSVCGVFVLSSAVKDSVGDSLIGILLLLGAGIIWTLYSFILKRIMGIYPAFTIAFYQNLVGALFFIPVVLLEHAPFVMPSLSALVCLIYLTLSCSVIAHISYNYSLLGISPSSAITVLNLVPVFGFIISVFVLQETVVAAKIVGGLIVIAGVLIEMRAKFKPTVKQISMPDQHSL